MFVKTISVWDRHYGNCSVLSMTKGKKLSFSHTLSVWCLVQDISLNKKIDVFCFVGAFSPAGWFSRYIDQYVTYPFID